MTETCEAEVADHSAVILHVFEQKVLSTKFLNHNSWHGVYNLLSRKIFKGDQICYFCDKLFKKDGFSLICGFSDPESRFSIFST